MDIQFQTVLVPLDGTPFSEIAIPYGYDLAKKYGAALHLLRVANPAPAIWDSQEVPALEAMHDEEKEACLDYLKGLRSSLSSTDGTVKVETFEATGNPAEEIVKVAGGLPGPIIVIASHARDGMQRWLMGSNAEKVARHASCPVFLVGGGEEDKK